MKIGIALTKSYSFHYKRKIVDCFHSPFLYAAKPPGLNLLLYVCPRVKVAGMIVSFNYNHLVGQYLSFVSDWNTGKHFLML